ncbi:MAG: MarR family transcriptional regulator [Rhodospirillales bacterium]|nr:MAG: MarR family transcriptional regulator [Rhodospirillales bacterium]
MSTLFHPNHTPEGSLLTSLMLEVFKANGALLAAGDDLTREIGLTSARWQVLGAIVMADEPRPVSYLARSMGLARQSVQRIVNDLLAEGFIGLRINPFHQKSRLVCLTEKGRKAYDAAIEREVPWSNRLANRLSAQDISTALTVLKSLRMRLEGEG